MKGIVALQNAYLKQKEVFEEARNKRIKNREVQIEQIDSKIQSLKETRERLVQLNQEEGEFEEFNSFRLKAEKQSQLSKNQETV